MDKINKINSLNASKWVKQFSTFLCVIQDFTFLSQFNVSLNDLNIQVDCTYNFKAAIFF